MNLKNLNFKRVYDSDKDDIINDFYIPALSNSIKYRRLAGSFSSSALSIAARGISNLVSNGGVMQLIAGAELREKDINAILEGTASQNQIISDLMINDLHSIEDLIIEDHVKALAWMIANKKLEMKVAIVVNKEGVPIDNITIMQRGIFHPKIGIFEDEHGNCITFGGSINESLMGWLFNDEHFYLFPNWVDEFKEIADSNIEKFETCWNGKSNKIIVIDVPTAYKYELIKKAPQNFSEINLEKWYTRSKKGGYYRKFNPNNFQPWTCQKRAVEAIKNNEYRGILKMATGTGKTACALFIFEQYLRDVKENNNRFFILVPSGKDRISGQWERFLMKHVSSDDFVYRYDSEISIEERRDLTSLWKSGVNTGNLFIVSTIQSLSSFPFNGIDPDFIVADEVHEYGTYTRMKTIMSKIKNVKYRLGLSATPERFYDLDGTQRILDYFGPIIYKYSIKEAQIEEKHPGSETVLANYLYNLSISYLNANEEEKVKELTQKIGKNIAIKDDPTISENTNISKNVEIWLQERARIIKTAKGKLDVLKKILEENEKSIEHCIVYCENTRQLNEVEKVFQQLNIFSYVKYHYNIKTRTGSLELFKKQNCKYILSINCLDQGLDIPSCQTLILLSASTNPRQYIQRKGRVLRNYDNKPLVQIFDILAFPNEINMSYRGLVKSQLLRAWDFIDVSQSQEEKAKIIDIQMDFDITSRELTEEIRTW